MSATRRDTSGIFEPVDLREEGATLSLSREACRISPNGIEFHSAVQLAEMTEMTIEVSRDSGKAIPCRGVVVGCHGNEEMGYSISFLFLGLTSPSLAELERLSFS